LRSLLKVETTTVDESESEGVGAQTATEADVTTETGTGTAVMIGTEGTTGVMEAMVTETVADETTIVVIGTTPLTLVARTPVREEKSLLAAVMPRHAHAHAHAHGHSPHPCLRNLGESSTP
jgi:predicted Rossmann-fold nucleotide-binding protein